MPDLLCETILAKCLFEVDITYVFGEGFFMVERLSWMMDFCKAVSLFRKKYFIDI